MIAGIGSSSKSGDRKWMDGWMDVESVSITCTLWTGLMLALFPDKLLEEALYYNFLDIFFLFFLTLRAKIRVCINLLEP